MSDEYLRIPTCPRCQRPHRYRLVVERSPNGNGSGLSAGSASAGNAASDVEAVTGDRATPLQGVASPAGAGAVAAAYVDPLVESRRTVRFTRRFICPWTAEGFQVTFPLKESCHARITDVNVIGTI